MVERLPIARLGEPLAEAVPAGGLRLALLRRRRPSGGALGRVAREKVSCRPVRGE